MSDWAKRWSDEQKIRISRHISNGLWYVIYGIIMLTTVKMFVVEVPKQWDNVGVAFGIVVALYYPSTAALAVVISVHLRRNMRRLLDSEPKEGPK